MSDEGGKQARNAETDYRPDIDGLRAVAVAMVVLYHAGMAVPGGFVGVDVFFVISGFLITSLIGRRLDAGSFDVGEFFARRVRRIVPAAATMTIATLLLGGLWLSPDAWSDLARSGVAEAVMAANFWFRSTIDYFQPDAELRPLLHTWSLAVEEQFYLVYPFALLALGRLPRAARRTILVVAALSSYALGEVLLARGSGMAAYYLLPARAWELLLGGIVASLPERRRHPLWHESEVAAGLAMILLSALWFDATSRFPGGGALLPCLGAAAVIHGHTGHDTAVGRWLAWRPLVAVGLLSYSLYLWHWPFLALARHLFGVRLPWPVAVGAVVLGVVAAIGSRRFLEEPFRHGTTFRSGPRTALLLAMSIALTLACSATILLGRGFPGRFSPVTLGFFAAGGDRAFLEEVSLESARAGRFPTFGAEAGGRTVLVWGDSHAMALVRGIDAACRATGYRGLQATHSATPPLLGLVKRERFGLEADGPAFNDAVLASIRERRPDVVVLACLWAGAAEDPDFERALRTTLDALADSGTSLAIVLDTAYFPSAVPQALLLRSLLGRPLDDFVVTDAGYREKNRTCEEIIRRVAAGRATIVDPREILADASGDWPSLHDGKPLYWDLHHLSAFGSLRLAPLFEDLLRRSGVDGPPGP